MHCRPFINIFLVDIYEFAGQTRTVNFAKGNLRFVPAMYLDAALESIEKMPQSTFDEIVEKYVEMNIAHPFQKGNGRSIRIWLDQILKKELGKVIDWSLVDKEEYLTAMKVSPIKDVEIKMLLKAALTDKINNKKIFMKGVDQSYSYDGYSSYKTKEFAPKTCTKAKTKIQEVRDRMKKWSNKKAEWLLVMLAVSTNGICFMDDYSRRKKRSYRSIYYS